MSASADTPDAEKIHSAAHPLPRSTLLARALRMRCPRCGDVQMFRNWFKTARDCAACGWRFEREPGYFLGSIYFNYGITALLTTAFYLIASMRRVLEPTALMVIAVAIAVIVPLVLFPFTRALWCAFDLSWDPPNSQETAAAQRRVKENTPETQAVE